MGNIAMDRSAETAIETILRDDLARGDLALRGVTPVLTHMLANTGNSLVSDAVVARLRGMLNHMSAQLIGSMQRDGLAEDPSDENTEIIDELAADLANSSAVLSHCYALAIEGELTEKLERKASIDQILTPLIQELIASDSEDVAELAMALLAAQSRFVQNQRRMQAPLFELPADLFQSVLRHLEEIDHGPAEKQAVERGTEQLRQRYDESKTRAGLLARLVSAMRGGARAALEIEHAGLALFASALSALTRQPRELAVLSCHERQSARLALGLRAAGLIENEIDRQFQILRPEQRIPAGFDDLLPDRAQSLLSNSDTRQGR